MEISHGHTDQSAECNVRAKGRLPGPTVDLLLAGCVWLWTCLFLPASVIFSKKMILFEIFLPHKVVMKVKCMHVKYSEQSLACNKYSMNIVI